ncbi:MAG: hypothetical protein K0S81_1291 [Rhodospirillales bacterium]|jgi:hypothetical protein|nr:hypothetical protein [Rhodospirillales bacterium]
MSWPWKIAVSLAWGLLLGLGAALHSGVALWLFARVFVFGDSVFPDSFDRVFLLGVAAAVLLAFAAVAALVFSLRRLSPALDSRLQRSAGLRWSVLAFPLLLVAGVVWAYERREAESARSFAAHQALEQRRAEAHRLTSAEWRLDPASGRLWIVLAADGVAGGTYTLSWEATDGARAFIGSGTMRQDLPAGPASLTVDLDAADFARRYAGVILNRNVETLIEVSVDFEFALALKGLPPTWQPPLRVRAKLDYRYSPDGTITFRPPS